MINGGGCFALLRKSIKINKKRKTHTGLDLGCTDLGLAPPPSIRRPSSSRLPSAVGKEEGAGSATAKEEGAGSAATEEEKAGSAAIEEEKTGFAATEE